MQTTFKILRFDSAKDKTPHYDTYHVEANPSDRVLDCLNRIRWEQDGSLSYRMSCSHGICGSDGMTINGIPSLACQKLLKDLNYDREIIVEPLHFFPLIKDLVVDMAPFFQRENSVHPPHGNEETGSAEGTERKQTIQERAQFDDDIKCIMCACCVAACPVNLNEEPRYVGPAAIVKAHRYIFDSRIKNSLQRLQIMDRPFGVWSCKTYFKCTQVCPKQIKVTMHILETKRRILDTLRPTSKESNLAT